MDSGALGEAVGQLFLQPSPRVALAVNTLWVLVVESGQEKGNVNDDNNNNIWCILPASRYPMS